MTGAMASGRRPIAKPEGRRPLMRETSARLTARSPREPLAPAPAFPGRHALREQEAVWSEFLAMGQTVVDSLEKSVAALREGRDRRRRRGEGARAELRSRRSPDRAELPSRAGSVRAGRFGSAADGDDPQGQSRLGADRRPGGADRTASSQAGPRLGRSRRGSRLAENARRAMSSIRLAPATTPSPGETRSARGR